MKYTYDFEIADILIRVESPFSFSDLHELSPFLTHTRSKRNPDAHYTIDLLPKNWTIQGSKLADLQHSTIYQCNNELHRYYFWNIYSDDRYVLVTSKANATSEYTIYLQESTLQRILPQFRLSAFLVPEQMLMEHRAFLLHSSVVDWSGTGILFTGPSGIGKSTQAQLWEQLEGAQIINGDRAIVRCLDGTIQAWGSPFAGTSRIYKNQGVPIRAIVVLAQGKVNTLQRLTGIAAFQRILQEATTQPWNPLFMNALTDLILRVTDLIPIYHLTCTPTAEAVEILKKELQ